MKNILILIIVLMFRFSLNLIIFFCCVNKIFSACSDSSITYKSSTQKSCAHKIFDDEYKCLFNACSKWKCENLTDESFCYALWEGMCCIERLVLDNCPHIDFLILKNEDKATQCRYEATNCTKYPKSSFICSSVSKLLFLELYLIIFFNLLLTVMI